MSPQAAMTASGRTVGENRPRMRISAKVDYAVGRRSSSPRPAIEPVKGEAIAEAQGIPLKFLENILGELKHVGIVASRRGAQGGYWLAKPADEIVLAEIVRAVEGPLATVRGQGPESSTTGARRSRCRRSGSRCGPTSARSWTR